MAAAAVRPDLDVPSNIINDWLECYCSIDILGVNDTRWFNPGENTRGFSFIQEVIA